MSKEELLAMWRSKYLLEVRNRWSYYSLTMGFYGGELPERQTREILGLCCAEVTEEARRAFAVQGEPWSEELFMYLKDDLFKTVFSAKQHYWSGNK